MTDYIIDSHAHLDHGRFNKDRENLIKSFEEDKVLAMINPGYDWKSSKAAVNLSNNYERVYALVGSHPHEAKYYDLDLENKYRELARNKKVVAIGEIGLDYYYEHSPRDIQKEVFIRQINLAKELDLPIVIHSRDAIEDTYNILSEHAVGMKVLLHSFSESLEIAERYLKLGYYISLSGVVTFKNANKLLRVGKNIPLERLLVETDAPYLTPTPFRGKRNQPSYTHYTAEKIAELKEIPPAKVKKSTVENTIKFFNLDIEY